MAAQYVAQNNLIGCKLGQYGGVFIIQELLHLALQHFLFGAMKVVNKRHLELSTNIPNPHISGSVQHLVCSSRSREI